MTYNFPPHRRGDTWDGISNISITQNGVPVNLTNASVKIDFRQSYDFPVAISFSTEASSIQITSVSSVRIMPTLIAIPPSKYYYDLQVTYPTGVVKTYITGYWIIEPDITE